MSTRVRKNILLTKDQAFRLTGVAKEREVVADVERRHGTLIADYIRDAKTGKYLGGCLSVDK